MSVSQVRKRGQARVHSVHPFAVGAVVRPPSASTWKGRYGRLRIVVAEHVVGQTTTQAEQPVHRPT